MSRPCRWWWEGHTMRGQKARGGHPAVAPWPALWRLSASDWRWDDEEPPPNPPNPSRCGGIGMGYDGAADWITYVELGARAFRKWDTPLHPGRKVMP